MSITPRRRRVQGQFTDCRLDFPHPIRLLYLWAQARAIHCRGGQYSLEEAVAPIARFAARNPETAWLGRTNIGKIISGAFRDLPPGGRA